MAIVINGSGTVTGISVGGLPDAIVDDGTLATDSVTAAKLKDDAIAVGDLPAGSVLQVVSTTKTDTFSFNTTGGWVTLTGMNTTLPAIQTGSKILISGVIHFGSSSDSNATGRIRDSIDDLVQLPSGSGQLEGHFGSGYIYNGGGTNHAQYGLFPAPFNYMYTPTTTASRTISLEVRNGDTNDITCYVNRSVNNDSSAWLSLGMSTITVMEIAG